MNLKSKKLAFFLKVEIPAGRIFGLDILRALAILFVVVQHGSYLLSEKAEAIIDFFIFDGVTIFFVLSGFLIGGILLKMPEQNQKDKKWILNFWVRRWLRTIPAYFLVLTILIILNLMFSKNFNFQIAASYFIFIQNIITPHPAFFPEAWSLSIEEWFYIITPLFIFVLYNLLKITLRNAILITAIFIVAFTSYYRYIIIHNINLTGIKEWNILYIFQRYIPRRLDSLMYGVIAAFISFYYQKKWIAFKNIFLAIGIVLLCMLKYYNPERGFISKFYYNLFYFSIQPAAILFILPFFSGLKTGKGFLYKSITIISLISYSMYLLNYSIIEVWIIGKIKWNILFADAGTITAVKYILYYLLTFFLSVILYKYFEKPIMNSRNNRRVSG